MHSINSDLYYIILKIIKTNDAYIRVFHQNGRWSITSENLLNLDKYIIKVIKLNDEIKK